MKVPDLPGGRRAPLPLLFGFGLVFTLCFLAPFYWPARDGLDIHGYPLGRDFINNWVGPQVAFSGRLMRLYDLDAYVAELGRVFGRPLPFHNWGYPPFCLLLYWPLGRMPYFLALSTWTFGLFAAFAWTAARLAPPGRRLAMVAALACAPASLINVAGGQNGFLSGALLLGGVLCLDRRPLLAGVLFGFLTFKPHLGLVLPLALVALGAWRTILSAVITTIALVAVSAAAFGLEPWRQYLFVTSVFQLGFLQGFHGFYTYMMCSVLAAARTLGASFALASAAQWAVSVPVILVSGLAMRWTKDVRQRAMILATATPLATPYAFNYDLTAVSAVVAWRLLARAEEGPETTPRPLLVLAWLTPILMMPLNILHVPIAPVALLPLFITAVAEVAPAALRARLSGSGLRAGASRELEA